MNEKYEKKIQADVDVIFTLMAQRVDEKQMNLLHEAYDFAAYAHKDQLRKSGEPYISHPVAVARIVAEELERLTRQTRGRDSTNQKKSYTFAP